MQVIPQEQLFHRPPYLEQTGQIDTDVYRVALLAVKTKGIYNPVEHGGIHKESPKVHSNLQLTHVAKSYISVIMVHKYPILGHDGQWCLHSNRVNFSALLL